MNDLFFAIAHTLRHRATRMQRVSSVLRITFAFLVLLLGFSHAAPAKGPLAPASFSQYPFEVASPVPQTLSRGDLLNVLSGNPFVSYAAHGTTVAAGTTYMHGLHHTAAIAAASAIALCATLSGSRPGALFLIGKAYVPATLGHTSFDRTITSISANSVTFASGERLPVDALACQSSQSPSGSSPISVAPTPTTPNDMTGVFLPTTTTTPEEPSSHDHGHIGSYSTVYGQAPPTPPPGFYPYPQRTP